MKVEAVYAPPRPIVQIERPLIKVTFDPADPLGQRSKVTTVIDDGYAFWLPNEDKFAIFLAGGSLGSPIPTFGWGTPTHEHFLLTFNDEELDWVVEGLTDPAFLQSPTSKYNDPTMAMIELLDRTVELVVWTVPVKDSEYDFTKAERL